MPEPVHMFAHDDGVGATSQSATFVPAPTADEVRACSFASWYPLFRRHTARSEIIHLPQDFIAFLLADGLHASRDNRALPSIHRGPAPLDSAFAPEDEESDGDSEEGPTFPELESQITAALERLGGECIPKLNWSAPKDSVWLFSHGSMKCCFADEVILMIKASVSVIHDLCHPFEACSDFDPACPDPTCGEPLTLVLKKWVDIRPSMEFRCFVRRRRLVAVSQRNVSDFFDFLPGMSADIADTIEGFFDEFVAHAFPAASYVFDVHINASGRVRLVDFNPWGSSTLPLLFTWEELERLAGAAPDDGIADDACDGGDGLPDIRVVQSAQSIRPGLRVGVPKDLFDTSSTSALADLIRKWGSADADQEDEDCGGPGGELSPRGTDQGGPSAGRGSVDGAEEDGGMGGGAERLGRESWHRHRSGHERDDEAGGTQAGGGIADEKKKGGSAADMSTSPSPGAR